MPIPKRLLRPAAWAIALAFAQAAHAFDPFVVRDIRVEGVQRTEPGTVFGYLPLRVGETLTEEKAAAAVRALYATGFFTDVRLEAEGDVLVVAVEERPAIGAIEITGTKEFDRDTVLRGMRDVGVAESRIYDRAALERAEQELKRQYLARGLYGVQVTSTVTPLERNRVSIAIAVDEGQVARIADVRIVGNQAFTDRVLLNELKLSKPTWLSWYTKNDQYSRERLAGDLEALRSFYLNRGYLEFNIDSTQVSITPDRREIVVTINISEGQQFRVSGFKFGGELMGREDELTRLVQLKAGDVFSGERLSATTKAISDRLGELGYAFANVNAVPQVDRDKRTAEFTLLVDPGRRVYVRRINISGNTRTRDEVVRREFRQFEGAWYDAERIRLSRQRVNRLGYFKSAEIGTQPVPDAPDQVDVNMTVEERPTGAFLIGAGISSTEKLILTGSISQQNFLGTGKSLDLSVNTSRVFRTISLSQTDPYFTPDGISRSFDLYTRLFDASRLALGNYRIRTTGAGVRFGIPYTEFDRISFGIIAENTELDLAAGAPTRFVNYVNSFGRSSTGLIGTVGWSRDTRDNALAPTRGRLQNASFEATLPVADLRYWRASYAQQWFIPVSRDYTLALNGDVGFGRGFAGRDYPLFKNFYAGGIGTVRGYSPFSLGPRDTDGRPTGGNIRVVGSAEFIFPFPGTGNDRSLRSFVFFDAGNVFTTSAFVDGRSSGFSIGDLRYSTGFGLNWLSPFGPLKLSLGFPLRSQPGDRTQRIQFQIGTGF